MQYMLLIYGNEQAWGLLSDAEKARVGAETGQFFGDLGQSGKLRGGSPLQVAASATTVRYQAGKQRVSAGPFADTKEQLGGYFVIEAADLDEALAVVQKMPECSPHTAVEIRPVMAVATSDPARM